MSAPLPAREDFGTGPGAEPAWENFGGKTLEEAAAIFSQNPSARQWDLWAMGDQSFRFYYPVFDQYLRRLPPARSNGSPDLALEAICLGIHFNEREDMTGIHEPVLALCEFVKAHLERYSADPEDQEKTAADWEALRRQVTNHARGVWPSQPDFGVCLDAQWAWKEFGGKSVEEAYTHFCENLPRYQEAFVCMAEGAFRFYFPVIDRFLRSVPPPPDDEFAEDDSEAIILGWSIAMRLERGEDLTSLHEPLLALCDYIQTHLYRFGNLKEQRQVANEWRKVRKHVQGR